MKVCISACKDAQRAWEGPEGASITMVCHVQLTTDSLLIDGLVLGIDPNSEEKCASIIEGPDVGADVRPCCSTLFRDGSDILIFPFTATERTSDALRYTSSLGSTSRVPARDLFTASWIIFRTLRYGYVYSPFSHWNELTRACLASQVASHAPLVSFSTCSTAIKRDRWPSCSRTWMNLLPYNILHFSSRHHHHRTLCIVIVFISYAYILLVCRAAYFLVNFASFITHT